MHRYLSNLWKTKSGYIFSLAILILLALIPRLLSGELPTLGDLGFISGCAISGIIFLGPIVYVSAWNIKIKNPRPQYIEKPLWMITLYIFTGWIVAALLFVIPLTYGPIADYIAIDANLNTFGGSFIMSFYIFSVLFAPITVYMVYVKVRYKRVVEYKTAEWRKYYIKIKKRKSKRISYKNL